MTADDTARAVDAAAAAVAGVARLYSARPAAAGTVLAVLAGDERAPLSVVRESVPVSIAVSIGVVDPAPSAEVAERVSVAVRALVGADAEVQVRVSRVHRS